MVKLNILDSMFHSSLQVIFPPLYTFLSHTAALLGLGHRSGTSVSSSWWHTSSTTRRQRSAGVAFCHMGVVAPSPRPPLPCWTWPTILRVDFACATATPGLHLLPVAKLGAAPLTKGSRDSVRVISSLAFEHLYSSTRLEIGRERAPLPYSPILLRHLGSPSHFLTCTFTNRSSRLAWDRVTSYMEIGHMRRGSSPN